MVNQNTEIIRNQQIIAKKIRGEFITLDANRGNLYRLNATAQAIWKSARVPKSIKDIVEEIVREFAVDRKKVVKEVVQFVNQHLDSLFFIVKK